MVQDRAEDEGEEVDQAFDFVIHDSGAFDCITKLGIHLRRFPLMLPTGTILL